MSFHGFLMGSKLVVYLVTYYLFTNIVKKSNYCIRVIIERKEKIPSDRSTLLLSSRLNKLPC